MGMASTTLGRRHIKNSMLEDPEEAELLDHRCDPSVSDCSLLLGDDGGLG